LPENLMTPPDERSYSETFDIDGYVVTRGYKFLPTLNRWEPLVLIRSSWRSTDVVDLVTKPEEYRDTPEDALRVAATMLADWLANATAKANRGGPVGNS